MATFHGIQIYEILDNGNLLHAVYTNTGLLKGEIDSEIARKVKYDNKGVHGDYVCRYIETNNSSVIDCILNIKVNDGIYDFTWRVNKQVKWKGIGLINGNHISVSYVHA